MHPWRRLVSDRPIVTQLVLAVAGTMAVVLVLGAAFVFWRVQYALDRQVDQDLDAYREVSENAVQAGHKPVSDTPGQTYEIYALNGTRLSGNAENRLVDRATVVRVAHDGTEHADFGSLLPPAEHPYRAVTARVRTPHGDVVVAYAISRVKHDEALRELLLQLVIADVVTLAAASLVGYRTARAALNPVERFRLAAERASDDADPQLPVPEGRDDELTRLGHTFNALLARIASANDRERQFLADASHELRSPLSLMHTELEWSLLRSRTHAENQTTLTSLHHQVERLIELCNALLDLEELRAGATPLHERVDLASLVIDVADRFAVPAAEAGRSVRTDVPDPVVVEGNRRWLDLAIGNLVSNALRYGAGEVQVSARAWADGAEVVVADAGPGFPEGFVDKAFDRFSRADESRSTRGTGLGLALVKAVAEAHGGQAAIDGPAVRLTLPGPDRRTPA